MNDKIELYYVNHDDSQRVLSLDSLHSWLISIDDQHFSKITDKVYNKHDSPKVIKLLDSLRVVANIEPSQNCKNVMSYIRNMSSSEILTAAIVFGVTRTRTEKFTESLCSMAKVIYGQQIPFILMDDRTEAGIMDSPVLKSKKELYAEQGIPDIQELAFSGSLTIKDILQWRSLRKNIKLYQDDLLDEGNIVIDFLIEQIGKENDSRQNTCQQLAAFCPHKVIVTTCETGV